MIARKLTCLVLAFVFALGMFIPATAGDTPPPGTDDNSIHPWDNNDGFSSHGGHTEVYSYPSVIFLIGPMHSAVWVFVRQNDKSTAPPVVSTRNTDRTPLRAQSTRNVRR
jgi:hypothetical protein